MTDASEIERLAHELEEAELYELKLRACIVAIRDELWNDIKAEFSDEQILEFILLAGFYRTVAYLTNGLRLPPESYAARFPQSVVT